MKGPQRRTLRELLAASEDKTLFESLADGRHMLRAPMRALASALSISPGSLTRRIETLVRAGLAERSGSLIIATEQIRQTVEATVISLPSERTRKFQERVESQFHHSVAADGTPVYHHPDGRRASLRDLSNAAGYKSRGTAQHQLGRLRSVPSSHDGDPTKSTNAIDACGAALKALGRLADIARATENDQIVTTVASCITQIADLAAHLSARVSARTQTRASNALRESKSNKPRDSFENEVEVESTRTQTPSTREPNAREPQPFKSAAIPSPARDFDVTLPDWDPSEASSLIAAPITRAWMDVHGKHVSIDTQSQISELQAWPKAWINRAVTIFCDHIRNGRQIRNPGAVFSVAVREGRLDYFPNHPPPAEQPNTSAPAAYIDLTDSGRLLDLARSRLVDTGVEIGSEIVASEMARRLETVEQPRAQDIIEAVLVDLRSDGPESPAAQMAALIQSLTENVGLSGAHSESF